MKTVAQWAEQLPELIRIEFLKEAEKQKTDIDAVLDINYSGFSQSLFFHIAEIDKWFWYGLRDNEYVNPTSADYIDETMPYTKEEVDAMILEFADPNDDVCKVMLANVLANQITGKVNQLSNDLDQTKTMDGFYSKMNLAKENEALKSTIEGLNAIVETQKVEIAELIEENHNIRSDYDKLKNDLMPKKFGVQKMENPPQCPPINPLEYATMTKEQNTQPKPSLFQRFLNLFK